MELYLQFGHGMMEHCRHLITEWEGGTVVLSPRDLSPVQLPAFASDITDLGGRVLLDPQFYLPRADHDRLRSHGYWPERYDTGSFFTGAALAQLLDSLLELNQDVCATEVVLPGLLAQAVDDPWLEIQRAIVETARDRAGDTPLIATIALDAATTQKQDHIAELLEVAPALEVSGFYVVCEHPNGEYLVQDPNWLANILDLTAGLRLAGKRVILGYCTHQLLAAGAARANAICSGTWMNVRSFSPDKFRSTPEDEIRQRATWYYCPQALSEYKIPFLDIAQRVNLLDRMSPPSALDGGYASRLFQGPQPTTVGFREPQAFRHYLQALRGQAQATEADGYDAARTIQEDLLSTSEELTRALGAAGVRGQQRDFADCVDVGRAALALLDTLRGPVLRRRWSDLA